MVRVDEVLAPRVGYPVWAKLESFTPSGSAKDRTAKAMVDDAVEAGHLGSSSVVVESSSGKLGVALARLATTGGCQRWLDDQGKSERLVAADSTGSVLFDGDPGHRLLPGYGAGVAPSFPARSASTRCCAWPPHRRSPAHGR